jgi:hypothetical protein
MIVSFCCFHATWSVLLCWSIIQLKATTIEYCRFALGPVGWTSLSWQIVSALLRFLAQMYFPGQMGYGYPVQQSSYTTAYDPTPWNNTYDPTIQTVTNTTSYVPVDVTPWDGVYNPILMRQDTRTVTTMQDITPWDGVYNPVVTTQQQTMMRPAGW